MKATIAVLSEIREAAFEALVWMFWDFTGSLFSYEWYCMSKEKKDKIIQEQHEISRKYYEQYHN